MSNDKKHMNDLHADNATWLSQLEFYKDELTVLNKRLEEVISRNNSTEVSAQVEHFQNQFIRQKEVLDILKHDVKKDDNELAANAQAMPVASDHRLFPDHADLREKMEIYAKLFTEMKSDFETFLSKTL